MSKSLRLADEWEHRSYEIAAELRRLGALVKEQEQEMDALEQEIERLRAQRVPLTKQQIDQIYNDVGCRAEYLGAITRLEIVRAIEAVHGIHPLQRLADLSKEIGEKL